MSVSGGKLAFMGRNTDRSSGEDEADRLRRMLDLVALLNDGKILASRERDPLRRAKTEENVEAADDRRHAEEDVTAEWAFWREYASMCQRGGGEKRATTLGPPAKKSSKAHIALGGMALIDNWSRFSAVSLGPSPRASAGSSPLVAGTLRCKDERVFERSSSPRAPNKRRSNPHAPTSFDYRALYQQTTDPELKIQIIALAPQRDQDEADRMERERLLQNTNGADAQCRLLRAIKATHKEHRRMRLLMCLLECMQDPTERSHRTNAHLGQGFRAE
ncbi:hypothetical protein BDK51DRAFT_50267 [Blyttiomyces helicus]|uniref:Uncharacterized protein n=1 Tax=Blyttiomyces helicus TaxID=388810 RepID=A0A4P9W918_9FUNG|nr:hypothetical protein BDK51DRAFT_50267 [Blyttiomyces helicus]|eukprot:RKO89039.1 hypothetical protein BDK51DRAFT_50267 [Blyttiomyces helicus]